ncbi:hypothetical protein GCM10010358_52540 [Streptomyces minutiscleroticus]|uniref:Uncharacterized protein n=1 Tax=Streptomyces minutiscleroticus TaxID=68238 RepID=A0A918NSY3_9ACTN|nr:hypothetical protein GCM10010358_52540 [Streptomyces minutiscleroticus]
MAMTVQDTGEDKAGGSAADHGDTGTGSHAGTTYGPSPSRSRPVTEPKRRRRVDRERAGPERGPPPAYGRRRGPALCERSVPVTYLPVREADDAGRQGWTEAQSPYRALRIA